MPGLGSRDLDALRLKIAAIENRPALAGSSGSPPADKGELREGADAALRQLLAAPPGLLQEIFADEGRAAGSAFGFALGLARRLLKPSRPAMLYLQLESELQERGLPYGPGLTQFGLDPAMLVIGRVGTVTELLWAMEEAIACRAVAAVVTDIGTHPKALDFTASRRLSMRATSTGASVFLIRYGREREASAARLRWSLAPAPSGADPFDVHAPGPPRFAVTLEKGRLGEAAQRLEGLRFVLEWVDHGFVVVERRREERAAGAGPALSRPQPAALGHRLSQAG